MNNFLWAILLILSLLTLFCILRCVKGPRNTDRVLAVNMVGSIGNAIIAVLATIYKQNFLADIVIIYTMLSFVAVIVMSRIVRGVQKEQEAKND
ncbi:MAG: monovalent cation/H+ antiporter complex subunit F [Bacillota bacterium]|nr:monovalent cation/H+ antiporter complex subunit F [Bacillota bacterium]